MRRSAKFYALLSVVLVGLAWSLAETQTVRQFLVTGPSGNATLGQAILQSFTKAQLDALGAGTAGRLARVTDDNRGLRTDTGTIWSAKGRIFYAEDFDIHPDRTAAQNDTGFTNLLAALPSTGARIILPPGTIQYNGIIVSVPLLLEGAGRGTTLNNISTSGAHAITIAAIASPTFPVVRLHNFRILGTAGGGNGIHSTATTNMPFIETENVEIYSCGGHGFYVRNMQSSNINNLLVQGCTGWGIFLDGNNASSTPNANTFRGIYLSGNNGNLKILGGRNNIFVAGSIQGAASLNEILIGAGTSQSQNNAFYGTWIEATAATTVMRILGQQNRFDSINIGSGTTCIQVENGSYDNLFIDSRITGGTNAFQLDDVSERTMVIGGSVVGAIVNNSTGAFAYWEQFTSTTSNATRTPGFKQLGSGNTVFESNAPWRWRRENATRYRADWSITSGGLGLTVFDDTGAVDLPFQVQALRVIPNSTQKDMGSASLQWRVFNSVIATGSLPAAGAAQDGLIIIEDAGAGNRNLIIYGGGERFRIDGGAAF